LILCLSVSYTLGQASLSEVSYGSEAGEGAGGLPPSEYLDMMNSLEMDLDDALLSAPSLFTRNGSDGDTHRAERELGNALSSECSAHEASRQAEECAGVNDPVDIPTNRNADGEGDEAGGLDQSVFQIPSDSEEDEDEVNVFF
jgi:hypothetical protein